MHSEFISFFCCSFKRFHYRRLAAQLQFLSLANVFVWFNLTRAALIWEMKHWMSKEMLNAASQQSKKRELKQTLISEWNQIWLKARKAAWNEWRHSQINPPAAVISFFVSINQPRFWNRCWINDETERN